MLLFHAVSGTGLRLTVRELALARVAHLSSQALHRRLRASGPWLSWIASQLFHSLTKAPSFPNGLRLRVVDATAIQRPGSHQLDWRLHYTLDLLSMSCDWFTLTDRTSAESLTRIPIRPGDVLLADRVYATARGIRYVRHKRGWLIVRLTWRHPAIYTSQRRRFRALSRARALRVGEVGEWPVSLRDPPREPLQARLIVKRLPAKKARRAVKYARHEASRKKQRLNPKTLEATRFIMLLTTVPKRLLTARQALSLYRVRWQVELAFKLWKQLLQLGHVPHRDREAARALIIAKLVVALLVEKVRRETTPSFPFGPALWRR